MVGNNSEGIPLWKFLVGGTAVIGVAIGGYVFLHRYTQRRGSGTPEPPEEFICPITREMMTRPVFTSDGHTYERLAIVKWLHEHNTSPRTGQQLPDSDLRPNHALRAQIADFRAKHGMTALPPWEPDTVENVPSIVQPNAEDGAGLFMPHPAHGAGMLHPQVPTLRGGAAPPDAFGIGPVTQEHWIKGISALLTRSKVNAASIEAALSLPPNACQRDARVVAETVVQTPQLLPRIMGLLIPSIEAQREFFLGMFWSSAAGITVPGDFWPIPLLAVRNADIQAVEAHVHSAAFSPAAELSKHLLVEAIWCKEDYRMTLLLLSKGVSPQGVQDSFKTSVLMGACFRGNLDVVKLLCQHNADVNERCIGGSTALHQAAYQGHRDIVVYLVDECGANANYVKDRGGTALSLACDNGHPDVALLLLEHVGAGALQTTDLNGLDPLAYAVRGGSLALVKDMLARGANPFSRAQDGSTSLHHAAWCGHKEILQYLLQHPSVTDPNVTNANGDSVLHIVAARGPASLVQHVLSTSKIDINSPNRDNFTPLHSEFLVMSIWIQAPIVSAIINGAMCLCVYVCDTGVLSQTMVLAMLSEWVCNYAIVFYFARSNCSVCVVVHGCCTGVCMRCGCCDLE
eukprot:m.1102612 g.1102612  ORF g.1102612 m.1102612 type:complete len:628 (-) comp24326_c0_seq94:1985-3868(-)